MIGNPAGKPARKAIGKPAEKPGWERTMQAIRKLTGKPASKPAGKAGRQAIRKPTRQAIQKLAERWKKEKVQYAWAIGSKKALGQGFQNHPGTCKTTQKWAQKCHFGAGLVPGVLPAKWANGKPHKIFGPACGGWDVP